MLVGLAPGRPLGSGIERDPGLGGGLGQAPGIDVLGQRDPEIDPADRPPVVGRRAEALVEGLDHGLGLGPQHRKDTRHVGVEMGRQVFRQNHLFQGAAAAVGLQRQDVLHHPPGRHQVADPQGRGDGLGEGAAVEHAAVLVQGMDRRGPLAAPDQVGITVVLEDRHVVLAGQGQKLQAPLAAHDGARGVLDGRDGEDVLGLAASAFQVGQGGGQPVHAHAAVVQVDPQGFHAAAVQAAQGAGVVLGLDDYQIPGVQEQGVH